MMSRSSAEQQTTKNLYNARHSLAPSSPMMQNAPVLFNRDTSTSWYREVSKIEFEDKNDLSVSESF